MLRGDRIVVLATEERGEFSHVEHDGRIAVWLDGRTGEPAPTVFDALDIDYCGVGE